MRYTLHLLKKSPSSNRWLQRQSSDPYVKLRTAAAAVATATYRSRSAFKLVSLSRSYSLLGAGKVVVDLGASPGGWSQVAANASGGRGVVAVDINPMDPVDGVDFVQGDFLDPAVQQTVQSLIPSQRIKDQVEETGDGRVDTVISDMMAPMSGVRVRDVQASLDLVSAATAFGVATLKRGSGIAADDKGKKVYSGGNMVLKFFMHPDLDAFKKEHLIPRFGKVVVDKPKESRKESSEAYFVCLGFKG